MTITAPDRAKLENLLGQAYEAYSLLDGFMDCFYDTEVIWGGKGKHGACSARYRQGGKTLCTVYFNQGFFTLLLVFGQKEREIFEGSNYRVCAELQTIYDEAYLYPEGKWLWIDIRGADSFSDIRHLISVKRKPDEAHLAMCGMKCSRCNAYVKNIKKEDRLEKTSAMWKKYFDLNFPKEELLCDGCRCAKKDAKDLGGCCPVRNCVSGRKVAHCGECPDFPCEKFNSRTGLSRAGAKEKAGEAFDEQEYAEYLQAYDNRTRLENYRKMQCFDPCKGKPENMRTVLRHTVKSGESVE